LATAWNTTTLKYNMTRIILKIGDVFSIELGNGSKKHFQYVANDLTQLNSEVIRVFRKTYPVSVNLDLKEIAKDEVEFYAHVVVKSGVKLNYWHKIGNCSEIGMSEINFRQSGDFGKPQVKVSENWYLWKINKPFVRVGRLEKKDRHTDIGTIVTPENILCRIRTGKYNFAYPEF
jgi:hypothetical protein